MRGQVALGYAKKSVGKHSYGDGIYLRVTPTGVSTWVLRVREGGKDTFKRLGSASAQFPIALARAAAQDYRDGAASGDADLTLGDALTEWAAAKRKAKWTERHYEKTLARLKKHYAPLWDTPVMSLRRPDIITHLEGIDCVDSAGRCYNWLRECLETLVDRGRLEHCILGRRPETLTVPTSQRRRQPSYGADYASLAQLYAAIKHSDASRAVRHVGCLTILTGLRIGEARNLRVEYIQDDRIVIPREAMKVKNQDLGDYQLPITQPVRDILDDALETHIDGYLFCGSRTRKPITDKAIEKLFTRLSDGAHVPHGSRTSLFTFAMETFKARKAVAQTLIDHAAVDGSDDRYHTASYLDERRAVLEAWAELLCAR